MTNDYEEETPEMMEREDKEYKMAEEAYEIAQRRLPILQFIARFFNLKIELSRPYLLHYKNKDGEITPSGFRIR